MKHGLLWQNVPFHIHVADKANVMLMKTLIMISVPCFTIILDTCHLQDCWLSCDTFNIDYGCYQVKKAMLLPSFVIFTTAYRWHRSVYAARFCLLRQSEFSESFYWNLLLSVAISLHHGNVFRNCLCWSWSESGRCTLTTLDGKEKLIGCLSIGTKASRVESRSTTSLSCKKRTTNQASWTRASWTTIASPGRHWQVATREWRASFSCQKHGVGALYDERCNDGYGQAFQYTKQ